MRGHMETARKPRLDLAKAVLPKPLLNAIIHLFKQGIEGCMLVGGTALSGFYSGHRRSDDIDLFTRDPISFKATVLAVKSLTKIGVQFLEVGAETGQYFRVTCSLERHVFTIDAVLDENIFRVGAFHRFDNGVCVADLRTLLMTKAATLVSRASEKDLYDLMWLFGEFPHIQIKDLVSLGNQIDAGVSGESVLISLGGANLSAAACDFLLSKKQNRNDLFTEIQAFRKGLIQGFQRYLEDEPAPPLRELVRHIAKLRQK